MSTVTVTTPDPVAVVESKPARSNTRKATIDHSAAIAAYAKAKNVDTTKAGKQFRAVLRSNADTYEKNGGKAHTKNAPWGDHPRKALKAIFPTIKAFTN